MALQGEQLVGTGLLWHARFGFLETRKTVDRKALRLDKACISVGSQSSRNKHILELTAKLFLLVLSFVCQRAGSYICSSYQYSEQIRIKYAVIYGKECTIFLYAK